MASDDSSGARPAAPIVLRIKLRYEDVEAMVHGFAANVGKSGLFLPTRSLQPLGAEVKFELRLANDTPVLVGLGRVKATTPPDPQHPRATSGMAIELMRVTPQSRALILRMLERRRAIGLPETALPLAADIDAARRVEPSEPPREPVREPASDALLTAPRRTTHPMPAAQLPAIAPLAPEPPRRRRVAVSEIVETASGPVTSVSPAVPGLEDEVDVVAALIRARALTGGEADAELDALAEAAAVPVAITVEGASAELARQLGGNAVRRDRGARWASPRATTATAEREREGGEVRAASAGEGAQGAAALAMGTDAHDAAALRAGAAAAPAPALERDAEAEHEHEAAPVTDVMSVIDDALIARVRADATPTAARAPTADPRPVTEPSRAEDAPIAGEVHQLDDFDLEDVEHTEMGAIPEAEALDMLRDLPVSPDVDQMLLADRVEAELAAAEADDDGDDDELGLAIELAHAPVEPRIDLSLEEIDEFEILAEADAGEPDHLGAVRDPDAPREASPPPLDLPELSEGEPEPAEPPALDGRPSQLDFASRLDLGDESDASFALPGHDFSAHHVIEHLDDDLADDLADAPAAGPGDLQLPDHLDSADQALARFTTGDEQLDELEHRADEHRARDDHRARDEHPAYPGQSARFDHSDDDHSAPIELVDLGDDRGASAGEPDDPDDHHDRFAHRRIVQPIFELEASGSFTLAGIPSDDFELPPRPRSEPEPEPEAELPPPRRRAQRSHEHEVRPSEPELRPSPPDLAALRDPVDDHELEHALEALDVDLDDLSIPHAATQLARTPGAAREPSGRRAPTPRPDASAGSGRATSHDDDEVIIDFDED